jgi:hypothetical protein
VCPEASDRCAPLDPRHAIMSTAEAIIERYRNTLRALAE